MDLCIVIMKELNNYEKGSAKEEYSLPLIRERNPSAERFLEGRNEEGSFETGIRKVDISVGIHDSSPLTDRALMGACGDGCNMHSNKGGTAVTRPLLKLGISVKGFFIFRE